MSERAPSVFADHEANWGPAYRATLIPDEPTPWSRMAPAWRKRLVTSCWVAVMVLLVTGWFDERAFLALVMFSAAHAAFFVWLVGFRPAVFPAQLRLAYLLWVSAGTFVPGLHFMLAIATVGGFALLTAGYCPLARLIYLLPWNRPHALTPRLAWQVAVAKPQPGRFVLPTQ